MGTSAVGLFPDLAVRPLTRHFVERLLLDLPPSPAMVSDFGIESEDHYRALKSALLADQEDVEASDDDDYAAAFSGLCQRILALDAAYGNGPRLTAFVRQYAPEYVERLRFETVWDGLSECLEADPA